MLDGSWLGSDMTMRPKYARTFRRFGTGEKPAPESQRWHEPRIPSDLPMALERFGICICMHCRDRARQYLGYQGMVRGEPMCPSGIGVVGKAVNWVRTEEWRELAWHGGDDFADWVCEWCLLQADPRVAIRAILTVCISAWEDFCTEIGEGPYGRKLQATERDNRTEAPHIERLKVYAFIDASDRLGGEDLRRVERTGLDMHLANVDWVYLHAPRHL